MKQYIKEGWKTVKNHFYIVIILFLYQLLWGFFLYRFIESIISPLLARYPNPAPTELSVHLFMMEGQFQLIKTDLADYYIWMLAGMFAIRMFMSPFINAGLLYSIHHRSDEAGPLFFKGIRKAWKPILIFYWLETIAALAPAVWIVPRILRLLTEEVTYQSIIYKGVPYLLAWGAFALVIHQMSLFMQFGKIGGSGILRSLWLSIRSIIPVMGVALTLFGVALAVGSLFTAAAMIWTGLVALILQQSYHLVRPIFKIWQTASQYHIWHGKTREL